MVLHRHHHPVHRDLHPLGGGLDDADIGLMRHDPVDVIGTQPRLVQGGMRRLGQLFDSMAKYFAALHPQFPRRPGGYATIDIQQVAKLPVAVQISRQNATVAGQTGLLDPLQYKRPGAVTEQHAGAAVGPVHQLGKRLGPDHQHLFGLTRHDQRIGRGQGIDKPRTNRLQIKGKATGHAKTGLHHGRRRRKSQIGGRGRQHDHINIIGLDAGIQQRRLGRPRRKVRRRLPLGCEMPPLDARPRPDPFIRGFDQPGQFGIRHHPVGQIMPDANDHGAQSHSGCPAPVADVSAVVAAVCPAPWADATRAASRALKPDLAS